MLNSIGIQTYNPVLRYRVFKQERVSQNWGKQAQDIQPSFAACNRQTRMLFLSAINNGHI